MIALWSAEHEDRKISDGEVPYKEFLKRIKEYRLFIMF